MKLTNWKNRWNTDDGRPLPTPPCRPCPNCREIDGLRIVALRRDEHNASFVRTIICACGWRPNGCIGITDEEAINSWNIKSAWRAKRDEESTPLETMAGTMNKKRIREARRAAENMARKAREFQDACTEAGAIANGYMGHHSSHACHRAMEAAALGYGLALDAQGIIWRMSVVNKART